MDDRAYWMYKVSRLEPLYLHKVEVFLEAAQKDARNKQLVEINCPCRDCKNLTLFPLAQCEDTLYVGVSWRIIHVVQSTAKTTMSMSPMIRWMMMIQGR